MSRYNRCKECYNMDCIFVTGEREDIDTSECANFRSMTNADRIRSMSDEELVDFMYNENLFPWCAVNKECKPRCRDCFAEWLKEEVSK